MRRIWSVRLARRRTIPCVREEPRQHRRLAAEVAGAVAADEPLVQIGGHDPEPRPQLEEVRQRFAEDADRRRAVFAGERVILLGQHVDERRFSRAVRADNGRVLAGADRQRQPVEDPDAVLDHGGVTQFENWFIMHHVSTHGRKIRAKRHRAYPRFSWLGSRTIRSRRRYVSEGSPRYIFRSRGAFP